MQDAETKEAGKAPFLTAGGLKIKELKKSELNLQFIPIQKICAIFFVANRSVIRTGFEMILRRSQITFLLIRQKKEARYE